MRAELTELGIVLRDSGGIEQRGPVAPSAVAGRGTTHLG